MSFAFISPILQLVWEESVSHTLNCNIQCIIYPYQLKNMVNICFALPILVFCSIVNS